MDFIDALIFIRDEDKEVESYDNHKYLRLRMRNGLVEYNFPYDRYISDVWTVCQRRLDGLLELDYRPYVNHEEDRSLDFSEAMRYCLIDGGRVRNKNWEEGSFAYMAEHDGSMVFVRVDSDGEESDLTNDDVFSDDWEWMDDE